MIRKIAWLGFLAGIVTIFALNVLWNAANPYLIQRIVSAVTSPGVTPDQVKITIWFVVLLLAAIGGFVTFLSAAPLLRASLGGIPF